MSFDTVMLKKGFPPLGGAYWRDVGFKPARNGRLIRNSDRTSMTVHQDGYGHKDWLMVQASLPRILFGHNATLPTESQAREAASWLCGYVSSETALTYTIDDVKAFRIDYTRDYDIVEDRARAVTLSLLAKDLPKFTHTYREGDSICFARERGGKVIKQLAIYPKFIWAKEAQQPREVIDATRGKLRLEVRLIGKGLAGVKGASKPSDYLSRPISDSLLNEAATMLDLQRIIDERTIDFHERLIVHARGHGTLGKMGLPTFIELVKRHGENFYRRPEFHYSKSTYYKRRTEAEQMGIWRDLLAASEVQTSYE